MDAKSLVLSKTFWGLVIAVAAPILAKHGWTIDAEGWSNDIMTFLGAGLALYGRFKADRPVKLV